MVNKSLRHCQQPPSAYICRRQTYKKNLKYENRDETGGLAGSLLLESGLSYICEHMLIPVHPKFYIVKIY